MRISARKFEIKRNSEDVRRDVRTNIKKFYARNNIFSKKKSKYEILNYLVQISFFGGSFFGGCCVVPNTFIQPLSYHKKDSCGPVFNACEKNNKANQLSVTFSILIGSVTSVILISVIFLSHMRNTFVHIFHFSENLSAVQVFISKATLWRPDRALGFHLVHYKVTL